MASVDLSEEQRSVLRQVEKLLRVANSTTHPEERESFEKKASDMLLAYNLSAAALGSADEGRRAQENLRGGFYKYERTLWKYVAEVNFCIHWVDQDWIERPEEDRRRKKVQERYSAWGQKYRRVTRQHLVGRTINVEATQFMVKYLKEAIERELRLYLFGSTDSRAEATVAGSGDMLRSKRATDFRESAADAIASRLWERRQDQEAEERRRQQAEEALRAAGTVGDGTGTALTIASVRQSERDANVDLMMGEEGYSARKRTEAQAQAAARRAAEEEYTKWAAAHPEEARAEEAKRRREERKRSKGEGRAKRERVREVSDWSAYHAGRDAGQRIGLDPQTTDKSAQLKIGGR